MTCKAFFFATILISSVLLVPSTFAESPKILSPLEQVASGITPGSVVCSGGFVLIIKISDNSPACVKPQTATKLIERGWGMYSQENKTGLKAMVSASNEFALSLFSNLKQKNQGNIFFSPYSISNAFSMVYEGSRGNTQNEIQSLFNFDKNQTERIGSAKAINLELNSPNSKYKLDIANAIWIQNEFPLQKTFSNILEQYYSATATNLDFTNNPDGSRNLINSWVENKTDQKISDLLPLGSIDKTTKLVLTNAIYFKGNWSNQFDGSKTRDENFTIQGNQTVTVPMMTTQNNFNYFSNNNLSVLEMTYGGSNLSMLVLLPQDSNLTSLESSLSLETLDELKIKLALQQVEVHMPKFTLNSKYTLNDNLASMGMPSAFSANSADFSGITGGKDLFINIVVHQAFVKVDEKGTEASAATGIGMMPTSIMVPQQVFRVDHPFMFMIYDAQTGLILFMGEVVDPTAG